ncbi:MAG: CoA transferase [Acidimicrobiales bacterium]|nr:CoA transferase [Acidimicrobiales bacterium]
MSLAGELGAVYAAAGGDPEAAQRLTVSGPTDVLPSIFRVTDAAVISIGAALLAAGELWATRTGQPPPAVAIDPVHAAAAFASSAYLRIDDDPLANPWDPLAGHYPAARGRWIQLHTNFVHHRAAALAALRLPAGTTERAVVAAAIAERDPFALETDIIDRGGVAYAMRTAAEWRASPPARAVATLPVVELEQVGAAPAAAAVPGDDLPPSPQLAAAGLRVLDLTRVIAGPVASRTLAALGADVLRIGAPHLPVIDSVVPDTCLGKRWANLDLRTEADRERFRTLACDADVVIRGYRPGALEGLGLGVDDLVGLNPDMVIVTLSAFGRKGPWAGRRGYDSLVQTASGIVATGTQMARDSKPRPLPVQALDYATGYFGAMLALRGLVERQRQGGAWHGQLSLARTGRWIEDLGPDPDGAPDAFLRPGPPRALDHPSIAPLMRSSHSAYGATTFLAHPGTIDGRHLEWQLPSAAPSDDPAWL